jgi:hypothetical protein
MLKKVKTKIPIIFLLLISIPSIFVLLKKGFYEPHDLHHIADIYEMVRAISSGQLPPRLGPDFSYGFGYPLFNYYYLLPFYLGAFFCFVLGSLTLSFKLVMIFGILVSLFGMYLFLKEITGRFPALVGSIVYLYTPYRAVEVYVRGAIGEVVVIALTPFVGWSLLKLIKKPTARRTAKASVIISLFLLSHNYLSFLSLPAIGLILLPFVLKSKNVKKVVVSLVLSFLTSLGITAYWWLPAILEKGYINATTPFPLVDHFPFLKQLIIPSWGYGASLWGPGDGLSFQIGLVNLAVVVGLVVAVFLARKRLKANVFYLCLLTLLGFLTSFVFMNIRTYPIWKLIPFYDFIQFPWRLLIFTTFYSAIAAALLTQIASAKAKYFLGLAIAVLSLILTVGYFHPSKIVYKTDNDYLARFFANRSTGGQTEGVSKDYIGYSEDYLLLPTWVKQRPSTLPISKFDVNNGGKIVDVAEINPVSWRAEISAGDNCLVTFNSYYFPGWEAKVDGDNVQIQPGEPYGQIQVAVSPGNHTVDVVWLETPIRKTVDFISLGFLTLSIFLIIKKKSDSE